MEAQNYLEVINCGGMDCEVINRGVVESRRIHAVECDE